MFEFFFKYPIPVFSKGKFVLLGAWPVWVLLLLAAAEPDAAGEVAIAPVHERLRYGKVGRLCDRNCG